MVIKLEPEGTINPSIDVFQRLGKAFGVSADKLLIENKSAKLSPIPETILRVYRIFR